MQQAWLSPPGYTNRPWYDTWCDSFRAEPAALWERWDAALRKANEAVPVRNLPQPAAAARANCRGLRCCFTARGCPLPTARLSACTGPHLVLVTRG